MNFENLKKLTEQGERQYFEEIEKGIRPAFGSPGGKRIISTMAFLISNLVDYDMDIQSAIMVPRFNNYEDGALKIEARIPLDVQDSLQQKGHELEIKKDFDLYFGGAQGIVIDHETGEMHGGADPRRDGKASGY